LAGTEEIHGAYNRAEQARQEEPAHEEQLLSTYKRGALTLLPLDSLRTSAPFGRQDKLESVTRRAESPDRFAPSQFVEIGGGSPKGRSQAWMREYDLGVI
jgi:hypothetical protein